MNRRMQVAAAALVAGLVVACSSSETDPVAPATHSTSARFSTVAPTATAQLIWPQAQEIKGWGVYPASGGNPFWNAPSVQDAVYRLGVTMIRDQLDPALYVSGTTVSNIVLNQAILNQYIAKIAYAKAHGATSYVLAVWSPPAQWKTNGSILGTVNGHAGWLQSWAEPYLVAFVTKVMLTLKYSQIGLPVAFSVQNEPSHVAPYAGCQYTPAGWQQLVKDVRYSFDHNGLNGIWLIGPETGEYTQAVYYDYLTGAPGYLGGLGYPALTDAYLNYAVGAYAFHTYAECSLWQTQQAVAAHPKDMWMTEYGNPQGSTEIEWTLDMMSALGAHLEIVPHNYWFWWMAFTHTNGPPGYGTLLGGETTPVYSRRYWALHNLFWAVRPGWHVNHMTTTDPQLQTGWGSQNQCTARVNLFGFSSPDRTQAVVVIVNTTSNNKQIQVANMPGTTQTSFRTDAWNDGVAQQTTNVYKGYTTISSPANSVVIATMK